MNWVNRNVARIAFLAVALIALTACGGGSTPPPTYSIGGTVSGIDAGQSVVLQDKGGNDLTVSANGAFTFTTKVTSDGAYAVTVFTQPSGKICAVSGGSGTAATNVTSVVVACAGPHTVGGTVSGIDAGQSVALQNNGADDLTVSANGAFSFATKVTSGAAYAVTILAQPVGKICVVSGGSGTASTDVTSVAVACASPYTVGGTVSGLVGQGLELSLDLQHLGISGNGAFVFPAPLNPSPFGHGVYIAQQPHLPAQRCVVTHPYFTMTPTNAADISDVNIVCGEFSYVTNAGSDTVSAFSIDATTGAFASVGPPASAHRSPSAIDSTRDKKYLYASNSGSNDVSAFSVDASSGALTAVPGSPFAAGTSPRAVSVYTASFSTSRGGHHGFLSYLYVANAGSDNLSAYQIDQSTGVPTPLSPAAYATGSGPSAMAVRADGQFLYIANSGGSNDISAFLIDPFSGGLRPVTGSPFRSGGNVSALAFGAGEKFLYAANASGSAAAIFGYSVEPFSGGTKDGALTSLVGFPYPLPSCTFIVADRTGTYLYATTGTNLLGYSIDAQTGALSPLPGFPVAVGANADSVSIDPSNQFLYVRNGRAGTVTGLVRNAATGELTPMPGSPFLVGRPADFIATF